MTVINYEFSGKPFAYSFDSVDYNYSPPKLKRIRFDEKHLKHIVKICSVLNEIENAQVLWRDIPTTEHLYRGSQANQIKAVSNSRIRRVIENRFSKELDSSVTEDCYPSYLSISKEIRLFGYQWRGVFKIVLIDFNHEVQPRD